MVDPILVNRCAFFPGKCIDGSQPADGEGAVDTHIDIPGDYRVYIGRRMGRAIGGLFGMVDKSELDDQVEVARRQAVRLAELEGQLAELRPIADSIARFADREGLEV